jgi:uncharacterized oligopeptide transporter (OPT) family protein
VGGVSLAALSVGMSWSPLMLATGAMMGIRSALSMALGAAIAWLGVAPWLVRSHIAAEASFGACANWLVWPGVGLLLAGGVVPLLFDWRSVARAFRDLGALVRSGAAGAPPAETASSRLGSLALVAGFVTIVAVGWDVFGLHPLLALVAVAIAPVLAVVSSRAAGETDLAPAGPVGTLVLLGFGRAGTTISLLAGSITMGTSSQAAQTLWAFKAGKRLGGSPRAQLLAQLLGALVGALVVVPVYLVVVRAYGIGSESLPAPGALTWRATAEAARGGLATLPSHAALAGALGLGAGLLLSIGGRARWGRFLPSPAAVGIAMLWPASISLAAAAGALAAVLAMRLRPSLDQESITSLAAGGIAGESVVGVIVAALIATGVFR